MRALVYLLLLPSPVFTANVSEVRLVFYSGAEYFEPSPEECTVRLLENGRAAGVDFDYDKRIFRVPYGRYTVLVETPGFVTYRREVLVSQPKLDLLVGLQLGDIANYSQPPPPAVIEGRVVGKNLDYSTLWLRAMPVFGGGRVVFDSRLDESGRFSITPYNAIDAESDKYVILVLAPKPGEVPWIELQVVAMTEVDVHNHKTTNVEVVVE